MVFQLGSAQAFAQVSLPKVYLVGFEVIYMHKKRSNCSYGFVFGC